jgi:hypothetical protein
MIAEVTVQGNGFFYFKNNKYNLAFYFKNNMYNLIDNVI